MIEVEPLSIAFKWMFYCFVGFLSIKNVFLLFDWIVGFDSLEFLPLAAAAILHEFKQELLECEDPEEVKDVFNDELLDLDLLECVNKFLASNEQW